MTGCCLLALQAVLVFFSLPTLEFGLYWWVTRACVEAQRLLRPARDGKKMKFKLHSRQCEATNSELTHAQTQDHFSLRNQINNSSTSQTVTNKTSCRSLKVWKPQRSRETETMVQVQKEKKAQSDFCKVAGQKKKETMSGGEAADRTEGGQFIRGGGERGKKPWGR